ncbi:unnamed protein product [Urochloa humidicola]
MLATCMHHATGAPPWFLGNGVSALPVVPLESKTIDALPVFASTHLRFSAGLPPRRAYKNHLPCTPFPLVTRRDPGKSGQEPLTALLQQHSSAASPVKGMATAAAGAARPSLVVAASMGAVEALKDQAGLCRWDYALRSLYYRAAAPRIHALSAALSDSAAAAEVPRAGAGWPVEADARMRKAYHLVCWGPN